MTIKEILLFGKTENLASLNLYLDPLAMYNRVVILDGAHWYSAWPLRLWLGKEIRVIIPGCNSVFSILLESGLLQRCYFGFSHIKYCIVFAIDV